ncbi:Zinc ABC transporter, periplasmic-binding protein ZnuA [hydrothermal vent metagenome]|uniref:Zinc ABC transporter, periplasmic-binding protein ZnuA n=1 Tax=hydrothermal vent metagenome TaxID=652676 RepID=A0A1W1EJP3_9ZZZZ
MNKTDILDKIYSSENYKKRVYMKKILILLVLITTAMFAKIDIIVSIIPEKVFVEAIGGDKVDIEVMVPVGSSPHHYEPLASQMKNISKANLYLSIGLEFEAVWLDKFANQNKNMRIVNISKNIPKGNDPHIWVAPNNIKTIAKNILDTLIEIEPSNSKYFQSNFDRFISKVEDVDKSIKSILKDVPKGSSFMVFHPSLGHFALEYNLVQLAIEIDGKSPKPKEMIKLIKRAKKEKIKAIFTSPEFSTKIANQIAKELGIKVVKVSPLAIDWANNLKKIAKSIANKR